MDCNKEKKIRIVNCVFKTQFKSTSLTPFTGGKKCLEKTLSLYQWLHSQVCRNGLKLWTFNVKIYIDKWRRIKSKLLKIFASKNLQMTKQKFNALI